MSDITDVAANLSEFGVVFPKNTSNASNSTSVKDPLPSYNRFITVHDGTGTLISDDYAALSDYLDTDLDYVVDPDMSVTDGGLAVSSATSGSVTTPSLSSGSGGTSSAQDSATVPTVNTTTSSYFVIDFYDDVADAVINFLRFTGDPTYPAIGDLSWTNLSFSAASIDWSIPTVTLDWQYSWLQPFVDGMINGLNALPDALNKIIDSLGDVIETGINSLGPSLTTSLNVMTDYINNGIVFIIDRLLEIYNGIIDGLESYIDWTIGVWTNLFNTLSKWLQVIWTKALEMINDAWSDWEIYIKANWKHVLTLDFNKVLDVVFSALEAIGLYDIVSFGGLKIGDAVRSKLDDVNFNLGSWNIYIPHSADPLLFSDSTISDNTNGNYHLSDAIKDLATLGVMLFGVKIIGPHGAKLMAKALGLAGGIRASLKEKARWNRLFQDVETTSGISAAELLQSLSSTIGLKLTF
jgi:hypothetical protein